MSTEGMPARSKKKPGRPAAGPDGERVSDYPAVMVRLPHPTKSSLDALSSVTGTPVWKLVDRAVRAYIARLSAADKRLIGAVRNARTRGIA